MDESKPPVSPSQFHLRSASERTLADIDPAPLELAKSAELATVGRQIRSGQTEPSRNEPPDGSFTVYYGNEEEVREGFLIALRAMGIAGFEQLPELAEPPVRGAKP